MVQTSHEKKAQRRTEREQSRDRAIRANSASRMKKKLLYFGAIAVALVAVVFAAQSFIKPALPESGDYDNFSKCLTDKGAIMYGTEWCPHCQNQKAMFGASFQHIIYIDCDASGGVCNAEGVTGYPTWKFNDGSSASGTQSLAALASKTGCQIA